MPWREQYLRNRLNALDHILANADYSYVKTYAIRQRKLTFNDLIEFQLENFNKE